MPNSFDAGFMFDAIFNFLGSAAQTEFFHTCAIFGFAALIHAKQVRKEIKSQFSELIKVLREDLDAQKTMLAGVVARVDRLENQLALPKEK